MQVLKDYCTNMQFNGYLVRKDFIGIILSNRVQHLLTRGGKLNIVRSSNIRRSSDIWSSGNIKRSRNIMRIINIRRSNIRSNIRRSSNIRKSSNIRRSSNIKRSSNIRSVSPPKLKNRFWGINSFLPRYLVFGDQKSKLQFATTE